jgi:hypothetical protein
MSTKLERYREIGAKLEIRQAVIEWLEQRLSQLSDKHDAEFKAELQKQVTRVLKLLEFRGYDT